MSSVKLWGDKALSGGLATTSGNVLYSYQCGNDDGELQFGDAVYMSSGANANGNGAVVKKLDSANKENLLGFVVREQREMISVGTSIRKGSMVAILVRGKIWTDKVSAGLVAGKKLVIDGTDGTIKSGAVASGDVTYNGVYVETPSTNDADKVRLYVDSVSNNTTTA